MLAVANETRLKAGFFMRAITSIWIETTGFEHAVLQQVVVRCLDTMGRYQVKLSVSEGHQLSAAHGRCVNE